VTSEFDAVDGKADTTVSRARSLKSLTVVRRARLYPAPADANPVQPLSKTNPFVRYIIVLDILFIASCVSQITYEKSTSLYFLETADA
jgi:hypothetical protein